jgi:hypothetical protein
MSDEEFIAQLLCKMMPGGEIRVFARERTDLEFKADFSENTIKKCLKTFAAFANRDGGSIVFGIAEKPRRVIGCDVDSFPDESTIASKISECLYPAPDFKVDELQVFEKKCIRLQIYPSASKPVVANRNIQTSDVKSKTVLSQGVVYFRRSGQSAPISGAELGAILERRDRRVRDEIMNFFSRGREIGFENAVVADFRRGSGDGDNVTLFLPEKAAKDLKIIDRARLVSDGGAPAYEIRGGIQLTVPSDKDPRKPMLPQKSVRAMQGEIKKEFGVDLKWSNRHLRLAAEHLGFWGDKSGDGVNTGCDGVQQIPVYYGAGRLAVMQFAKTDPEAFIEVVASKVFKEIWRQKALPLAGI